MKHKECTSSFNVEGWSASRKITSVIYTAPTDFFSAFLNHRSTEYCSCAQAHWLLFPVLALANPICKGSWRILWKAIFHRSCSRKILTKLNLEFWKPFCCSYPLNYCKEGERTKLSHIGFIKTLKTVTLLPLGQKRDNLSFLDSFQ